MEIGGCTLDIYRLADLHSRCTNLCIFDAFKGTCSILESQRIRVVHLFSLKIVSSITLRRLETLHYYCKMFLISTGLIRMFFIMSNYVTFACDRV